ncbi:hypothetical protein L484_005868 [Morus notabilis]|uniref:Uncharacterized protein n=1 Tax=Morus notabilis TaxID=981085 RepID=W9RT25_9ROSA|nr:hypothetical protein L484_005868 [Morus notabilis]
MGDLDQEPCRCPDQRKGWAQNGIIGPSCTYNRVVRQASVCFLGFSIRLIPPLTSENQWLRFHATFGN